MDFFKKVLSFSFIYLFISSSLILSCYIEKLGENAEVYKRFKLIKIVSFDDADLLSISKDSRYVAICFQDNSLRVYDLHKDKKIIYEHKSDSENVYMRFSKNGTYLMLWRDDYSVIIHDIKIKKISCEYNKGSKIISCRMSKDEKYVASYHDDNVNGSMVVYDIKCNKKLCDIKIDHNNSQNYQEETIDNLVFSQDSKYVACGFTCGQVIIYDIQKNKKMVIKVSKEKIMFLRSSKKSKYIFAHSKEGVFILDIEKTFSGKVSVDTYDVYRPGDEVIGLEISQDDAFLAVAGAAESLSIYSTKLRKESENTVK